MEVNPILIIGIITITIPLSMGWQIGKILGIRLFFKIKKGVMVNGKSDKEE